MNSRNGYCDVEYGSLYFEVSGAGVPVVLIQGFGLNLRYWDDLVALLAEDHLTVCYDRRGFGSSTKPRSDSPYSDFGDLCALLDHLGLDAVHLVTECVGGQVALEMASAHPSRVKSLVLSNPDAIPGVAGANSAFYKLVEDTRQYHAADQRQRALEAAFRNPIIAQSVRTPEVRNKMARAFAGYDGWHFLNWYPRQSTNPAVNDQLQTVKVPTLIIRGGNDYLHFHRVADKVLEAIPHARQETLPEAGHYAFMEFPEECATLTRNFLISANT